MSDFAKLAKGGQEPTVQHFRTIGAIEAFNESILIRRPGLDMAQFGSDLRLFGSY
jgi:hypothetical protein